MQEAFSLKLREEQNNELVPLSTLAYAINMEAFEINRRAGIIGNYLIQAKQQLPGDGSFMTWVSENCPFSHSTALNLMKNAPQKRLLKPFTSISAPYTENWLAGVMSILTATIQPKNDIVQTLRNNDIEPIFPPKEQTSRSDAITSSPHT